MEHLKVLLFEDPLALQIGSAFALAILLFLYLHRRDRRLLIACLIPVLIAVGAGFTAALVETPREQVEQALHRLSQAVTAGDMNALAMGIDDNYFDGQRRKSDILSFISMTTRNFTVDSISLSQIRTHVDGDTAASRFRATAFKGDEPMAFTEWEVFWVLRPTGWKVHSGALIGPQPLRSLASW